MVSERAPPGRATAVRRRRRPAGARPRGGTAPRPAAVSARPAVRLRLWSRPQAGGGQPQGPSAGGVAPESRDLRYVTANRASCSLVGHHPYQNHLRPVCQNRSTPHQTPFRRCRHPTWAGLAPRRRRVARRVADRLATRGRGAAQAGRPRLALDWHDRYVDPSRRSGHRSRAFCSRAGGAAAMWEGPMPARGSSSSQNPNTQATHAGPTATPRPTHGLCATRGTDPGRPGRQARRRTLTAREPNTFCVIGQLRIPLTARAPPGVLTRRATRTNGLCANHLGQRHRR